MYKNCSIKCDVHTCKHNVEGKNCNLNEIKVGCGCQECTCCESFDER